MGKKARPNDPCPCGSGLKFKKCCGVVGAKRGAGQRASQTPGSGGAFTRAERESAIRKLWDFIDEFWGEDEAAASDEFWGERREWEPRLSDTLLDLSFDVEQSWFAFDYELEDLRRVIDHFLDGPGLSRGERVYCETMRDSAMAFYEVADLRPGSSITLRDLVSGRSVTVAERRGSRSAIRGMCLAARVIPRGVSGQPEIDGGLLQIPTLWRDRLLHEIALVRAEFEEAGWSRQRELLADALPPIAHEVWLLSMFEPAIPRLANTDGESLVWTRVSFHVDDEEALRRALDEAAAEGLRSEGDRRWGWTTTGDRPGGSVSLGQLELGEGRLTVECNSVERGERARTLIERLAPGAVRHRSTSHEDVRRQVAESVTQQALAAGPSDEDPRAQGPQAEQQGSRAGRTQLALGPADRHGGEASLDPHLQEALTLNYYAAHYRAWIDAPVPALDGHTPREAAAQKKLRPRVDELLRGLESHYEGALKAGRSAYDPSWMRIELGLAADENPPAPPPLAHERIAAALPGSAEVSWAIAERLRAAPTFSEASTTASERELARDLELQRFLRRARADEGGGERGDAPAGTVGAVSHPGDDSGAQARSDAESESRDGSGPQVLGDAESEASHTMGSYVLPDSETLARYLWLLVNFELHRRKLFWVDAALAYMLEHTDIRIANNELRAPFPSSAFVFSDRHSLALAERVLAERAGDPLRGQILRALTAYVQLESEDEGRALSVTFACDALGADLPSLVSYRLPADGAEPLHDFLEALGPRYELDGETVDTNPLRALLRLLVNSVLYATSANVRIEERPLRQKPKAQPKSRPAPSVYESDKVFVLPTAIEIRDVRRLQELDRSPGGRALVTRHLVRGHWRRAPANWVDQRLRWIEPYWKGPDLAAVIERAYRLRPAPQR